MKIISFSSESVFFAFFVFSFLFFLMFFVFNFENSEIRLVKMVEHFRLKFDKWGLPCLVVSSVFSSRKVNQIVDMVESS